MTLQESLQRLLGISNRRKELTKKIKENCLHAEKNSMLYERWLNTRFEGVRQKIRQEIANGEKKWEELLEFFPIPDKPFDINDVEDEELKSCILEIERLEAEDHELFSYVLNTFKSKEDDRMIIKDYLAIRFPRLGNEKRTK